MRGVTTADFAVEMTEFAGKPPWGGSELFYIEYSWYGFC